MIAAIYIREPMNDRKTGHWLMSKARQIGWEAELFYDRTKKRKTRPAKYRLLKQVRNNEYDAIIVNSLNAWANTLTEMIRELAELTNKGITFISVSDELKLDSEYFASQNQFLRALNTFEQSNLNEKASLAIKRSKTKGKFPGRPSGSKDRIKRKNDGYLVREARKRQMKRVV